MIPHNTSSYCLLSNGDLHFLPYNYSHDTNETIPDDLDSRLSSSLAPSPCSSICQSPYKMTSENLDQINLNYPFYSNFLSNKTLSSLSCNISSDAEVESLSSEDENSNNINNNDLLPIDSNHNNETNQISSILNNYCSHAIYLPDYFITITSELSKNKEIKSILLKIFPHWRTFKSEIKIKQLTGGITNILLECYCYNSINKFFEKVLVRSYGKQTDLIIDRDNEFVSHLVLNSLNLAPPIYARFGNGLVYGYISGRSLTFDELSNSNLYPLIASKLADLHRLTSVHVIQDSLLKLKQKFNGNNNAQLDIWSVLKKWLQNLPEIPNMLKVCEKFDDIKEAKSLNHNLKEILIEELNWLKFEIGNKSPIVASHSDLLSGNIIIPHDMANALSSSHEVFSNVLRNYKSNPVSFIDYEYMMPAPRAFDISNHFMEWQGFDCKKSLIPEASVNDPVMLNWCKSYLSQFITSSNNSEINNNKNNNNNNNNNDSKEITQNEIFELVNEINAYYGMPGLYWGIWAGIQSTISLIDFDYASYSCERLVEYWNWKKNYLKSK